MYRSAGTKLKQYNWARQPNRVFCHKCNLCMQVEHREAGTLQSGCLLMLLPEVTRHQQWLCQLQKNYVVLYLLGMPSKCLYMKTQCANSPAELRSLAIDTLKKMLNRSPLNNAKHQTLIRFVYNRKHQVRVPALIITQDSEKLCTTTQNLIQRQALINQIYPFEDECYLTQLGSPFANDVCVIQS